MVLPCSLRKWTGVALAFGCLVSAPAFAEKKPDPQAEMMASMEARMLTLQQTVEGLTGQIEELRYKNTQQAKQLQLLQDDLSTRVMALEQAAGGRAALPTPAPGAAEAAPPFPGPSTPRRGAEGYPTGPVDPNAPMSVPVAKQPEAMPAPGAVDGTPASAAPSNTPAAPPVTENGGFSIRLGPDGKPLPPDPNQKYTPPPASAAAAAPPKITAAPQPGSVGAGGLASAGAAADVTLPSGPPKTQYDYAANLMRQQDYAKAEAAFREFIKRNPKDPLAANAQYWLAESFYVRGDYQQAAVEFMEGYKNYRTSPKGPDNLLKMGMALENMRQTAAACTAFGSIAKEYPNAEDKIRKDAQAERTKLKCS
jgi:tol-pal system protein YbgF